MLRNITSSPGVIGGHAHGSLAWAQWPATTGNRCARPGPCRTRAATSRTCCVPPASPTGESVWPQAPWPPGLARPSLGFLPWEVSSRRGVFGDVWSDCVARNTSVTVWRPTRPSCETAIRRRFRLKLSAGICVDGVCPLHLSTRGSFSIARVFLCWEQLLRQKWLGTLRSVGWNSILVRVGLYSDLGRASTREAGSSVTKMPPCRGATPEKIKWIKLAFKRPKYALDCTT